MAEDSLLFSLNSLLQQERDRVQDEKVRTLRRDQEEQQRKVAAEQALRERELARQRALEQAKFLAEQQQAESALRAEAMKLAELERARIAATQAAVLETRRQEQEHALRLAEIRSRAWRTTERYGMIFGLVVAALTLLASACIYYLHLEPERSRTIATYDTLLSNARSRAAQLEQRLEVSDRERRELQRELERLRHNSSATPGSTLQRPPASPPIRGNPGTQNAATPPDKQARCVGDKWDPLNPCLAK